MILRANNLSKSYGDVKALQGFNLELAEGKILGLLGENGAGKSSAIRLLTAEERANEGKIYYRGEDIYKDVKAYQAKIAYVPQEIALFEELSVLDNLRFWARAYGLKGENEEKIISKLVGDFSLKDKLKSRVSTLSGGYMRRVNIASALFNEPEIIFLDEPTVGIDIMSRNEILSMVKQLAGVGKSIIYTSHYINEIEEIADSVLIMKEGRNILRLDAEAFKNTGSLEKVFLEVYAAPSDEA